MERDVFGVLLSGYTAVQVTVYTPSFYVIILSILLCGYYLVTFLVSILLYIVADWLPVQAGYF